MSALSIRDLALADHDAVVALWVEAWTRTFPQIDFVAREPFARARIAEYAVPPKRARLADAAGAIVGFTLADCSNGELDQIAVHPDYWGRRVAEALFTDAMSRAPGRLFLTVNRDNPRAIAFYRRRGLYQTGASLSPRSGLPLLHMEWNAKRFSDPSLV